MLRTAPLGEVAPACPLKLSISAEEDIWQVTLDHIQSDSGQLVSREIKPFGMAGSSTHGFDERYVLYSKLRPYLNKVLLPDRAGVGTTELVPLLPDPERIDRKYLGYYLRSKRFVTWARERSSGAKMPRVSMSEFWKHEVPLPGLREQRRIAAILDKADAIRRKRQQAIELADQFLRSVFLDMFGDPVANSKGLRAPQVEEFCEIVRGSSPRPKGDPRYYGGPVPRLMVHDLTRDGYMATPRIDSLTLEGAKKSRPIKAGTVVMAVSGNVGLTAILTIDACIHDGFVAFKNLDRSVVLPEYLLFVMTYLKRTHEGREAGAIFKNLTTSQIKSMQVPVPKLPMQEKFVDLFSRQKTFTDRLEEAQDNGVELFESTSQRAFTGEL